MSAETYDMVTHYRDSKSVSTKHDLVFPTATGHWQNTENWRKRGFYVAGMEAGLIDRVGIDGKLVEKPKYKPYVRASMVERGNLTRRWQ